METKVCEYAACGKEYTRTMSASGKLQPGPTWRKRRFCSPGCAGLNRKDMRTNEFVPEVEWILGTDHPESIAKRVGFETVRGLIVSLGTRGRQDLAERLSRELERYNAPLAFEPEPSPWYA